MSPKEMTQTESRTPEPVRDGQRFVPQADIYEDADELTLLVDMPGVDAKDIDVNVERGVLQIYGRAPSRQAGETSYALKEYEVGDYFRSFEVGDAIDTAGISAEHRDGVLTLHLPKSEKLRPKRIEVRAAK